MAPLGAGPVAGDERGARHGENLGRTRLPCTKLGRDEGSAIWARVSGLPEIDLLRHGKE